MTDRATLFAHVKCSPAGAVHPIQPLLRGAVFPATPRANACLSPAFGSAKQRPPSRQPPRFGTCQKRSARRPDGPATKGLLPANGTARGALTPHRARAHNAPGAGLHRTASAPGAGLEGTAPEGPAVGRPGVSVRGLILRDDRRGDAAALADLVAALLGPGPDFRTALTAGPAPGAAAAATGGVGTACVLCVLSELLAQFLGVCRAHVDLIGGSVKGERNRLRSLDLTVMWKVTHDRHHCLLCHGASPSAGASIYWVPNIYHTLLFDNSTSPSFPNEFTTGRSGRH